MPKRAIIAGSLIILTMLSTGAFLLFNSLTPMEKKNVLLESSFSVAGNRYENRTVWIGSIGDYVASFNVSEGIIKFAPMLSSQFSRWLDGQFEPSWVETDQTDYGMSMGGEVGGFAVYFVFVNNDSFTKEVRLEVSKVWRETNYIGLLGGAALILSGGIAVAGLKYTRKMQAA